MKKGFTIFLFAGIIVSVLHAQNIEWNQMKSLPKPMRGTAVSCDDKIYFMEANHRTSGVYEYRVIEDAWTKLTKMKTQGWNVNLAEIDGVIYAVGGDPFRDRLESFEPEKKIWNTLTPMPTARQHSNCCVVNESIYVMGGITGWTVETDKNEVYNPVTDSWETAVPLPESCENPIIAPVDSSIYVLCKDALWLYDTVSGTWQAKDNCPVRISVMFGYAVIDDMIIFAGGQDEYGKALASVYIYNTATDEWSRASDLPYAVQLGGITTLDDKIYLIGGCDTDFNKYNTVLEGTIIK